MNRRAILLLTLMIFCGNIVSAQFDRQEAKKEVQFLLDMYKAYNVDYLRGMTEEDWSDKVKELFRKVDSAQNKIEYLYALRYFGSLIHDYHSAFPDIGVYNRNKIFKPSDTIFPLWVKIWHDGRVFVVNDYTKTIPVNAELHTINGFSVIHLALKLREITPAETKFALAYINDQEEGDIRGWSTFPNMLFCEKITAPYHISFSLINSSDTNNVVVNGITRRDHFKLYKKSGAKKIVRKRFNFWKPPIEYAKVNDSIGVLDINLFYGKNYLTTILLGKDTRYPKLLQKKMNTIIKDNLKHLIIDLRGNIGGYENNIYHTMDYLTDMEYKIDGGIYKVTDESRKYIPALLKDGFKTVYENQNEEEVKTVLASLTRMPNESLLCVDSIFPMIHRPRQFKNKYRGKVYVLTDALTYSASIDFCNLIRILDRGLIVGEPPGGYSITSVGVSVSVRMPYTRKYFSSMDVSFAQAKLPAKDEGYKYIEPDYLIETTFEDWLINQDNKLDHLIDAIKTNKL
jgi:hypothetical protein